MRLTRFIAMVLMFAALPAAYGQQVPFPEHPLRLIIGYAPGGSTDIVGRIIAAKLAESLGKAVIVDNKPGASGAIGSAELVRAAPDGYTLIVHIVTTAVIGPLLQKDLPFNAEKDFQPVAMIAKLPNVMIVNRDIPAKNLREFINWAKANPGKVNYGTGG